MIRMDLSWSDIHWEDPDGGTIVLHGTLPTVVYPISMRPRLNWHGLGLLATSEEPDVWQAEEEAELEDSGINLDSAILGGGIDGYYLEMLTFVEDLQVGRFPDPEPRRLHKAALKHGRLITYAEPDFSDEDWVVHLENEAKAMTTPRKLLGMVLIGRKWRKRLKSMREFVRPQTPKAPDGLQAASSLCGTWWSLLQERSSPELNLSRDQRFAARLRGGLAILRQEFGNDAVMLVPLTLPWRAEIHQALDELPTAEDSSVSAQSEGEEE